MRVLLVEDEAELGTSLARVLERRGLQVQHRMAGAEALQALEHERFDVAVLDIGLPGMDGLQLLQRLRDRGHTLPVLLLTARGGVGDRVAGLNAGADDYLAKPFDPDELEARLRALARRAGVADEPRCGELRLDRATGAFYWRSAALELTPRESALLAALMERPGRAVTRARLTGLAFGADPPSQPDAVEVVVHRLRKKLVETGVQITTLRGLGYLVQEVRAP
ncbi:response regulator transcription factor [Pseudorhodoferax sp. Leaf267]|uniref:response regulator transcription factor n=1 Tax=Pseudorhodoferax sp. Leaf267 TaxID=1736316 RepID=UPI0006F69124|nr:response regulator transcription factor [Pseudorhodoferax sp. Leaf267]KQP12154.1 two-component system response regulator [Pseudorhodoferax sp. Leaf267]